MENTPERSGSSDIVTLDVGVWSGRFFGILMLGIGMSLGVWAAIEADEDEFWTFLFMGSTSWGFGFLIIVASEIVNRISRR